MDALKYSIVVPVDNEEESIAGLTRRLREIMGKLDGPAEAVLATPAYTANGLRCPTTPSDGHPPLPRS